jgi:hypothetical protein
VSSAVPLPADELVDVRPGDHAVATAGDAWLRAYAANRDPVLREMTETELLATCWPPPGLIRNGRTC